MFRRRLQDAHQHSSSRWRSLPGLQQELLLETSTQGRAWMRKAHTHRRQTWTIIARQGSSGTRQVKSMGRG